MTHASARTLNGRYRLESELGRGGMAVVWRAVDARLHRPVAVKLLDRAGGADPVALQRFDREARAAAGVVHPNIVAVYDVGTDQGAPYLVMELINGRSLDSELADGRLAVQPACRIAAQVCAGLQAAHAAGVVHRDIKPANVLITEGGTAKICDFGVARLPNAAGTNLTDPDHAVGTSLYMAPEQTMGGDVDARADLYALGCVLYHMLAGHPPFTADHPLRVLWQHAHNRPTPIAALRPEVPGNLAALVDQLLAKDPAHRPAASDVMARLHQIDTAVQAAPLAGRQPPVPGTPSRTRVDTGAPPMRGGAPVPTQTLPVADDYQPPVPPHGLRLGPAGIAAVAAGVAVLTAFTVALLVANARPAPPPTGTGTPTATASTAAAAATTAAGTVAQRFDAARAAIDAGVRAGDLDRKAGDELVKKLDEAARHLAKDQPGKAGEKVAEVRRKLDDLRDEDKLTAAGYDAIAANLNQLADVLPTDD